MRIRTMAGLVVAGTAAAGAIAGGVAYAAADEEPIVRIVEQEAPAADAAQPEQEDAAGNVAQQEQPREDCPEKDGSRPSQAGL